MRFQELNHSLANLELLTAKENQEKSGQEFETWISTRHSNFRTRQFIPDDEELWKLENFAEFVEAREELIQKRFESLFVHRLNKESR